MHKTLIGKNGYLFLQNDSAKELEIHNNNLCFVDSTKLSRYNSIKNKYMMIVFPNKSFLYKSFLPDGYNLKYRPGFEIYKKYFCSQILDGYTILKNETDVYYKTDTHINLKGSYIIYCKFIESVNKLFNLNILKKNCIIKSIETNNLTSIGVGIGDLTWEVNLGKQTLYSTNDNYYYSDDIKELYCKHKIINNDPQLAILNFENNELHNVTNSFEGHIINWNIISKYILYKNNSYKNLPKLKVLIFFDSFLSSSLSLYLEMFDNVFMVKQSFNIELVNFINPNYVFEFRAERFLL